MESAPTLRERSQQMSIRFENGTEIDTGGPLRILRVEEGLYVTGEGHLIPCGSEEEAEETIRQMIRTTE
jgi:hypothetical protein